MPIIKTKKAIEEIKPDEEICVVCRTGNHSDLACQLLEEKGFTKVKNVLPGMTQWMCFIEKLQ